MRIYLRESYKAVDVSPRAWPGCAYLNQNGCNAVSEWDDNSEGNNSNDQRGQNTGGGGLRKQLEETLARLKVIEDENATLKTQTRHTAISGLLTEKKLPAKVAKLIPADIEPTAEAVGKWLEDFGDVFNITKDEASADGDSSESSGDDADAAMEYIQTMRQMGNINGGMLPPAKAQDLLSKINDPNLKHEDLINLINAHGGGVGMG